MPRAYVRHERLRQEQRKFRVLKPKWVDPNWWVEGSDIEKMVMAELLRRGIYFIFRNQNNTIGGSVDPTWEADFLVPQHKIWIEVQGAYWHSKNNQIKLDAFRYAALEAAGWTPLFWWEWDIKTRLQTLFDQVPLFYRVNRPAESRAAGRYGRTTGIGLAKIGKNTDQRVGLRKALERRGKPEQFIVRHRRRWERRGK